MKIAILCAVFFSAIHLNPVEAQESSPRGISQSKTTPVVEFSFVRGHKQGKGFSVQWSMSSNAGVEAFVVQSTYEDPSDPYSNWYTVGNVNVRSRTNIFQVTDQNTLPGVINYRVLAFRSGNRDMIISPIYTTSIR